MSDLYPRTTGEGTLRLTPEQWVELINGDGKWLQICCANVSAIRDALISTLRNGGFMTQDMANQILANFRGHGGIEEAFIPPTDGSKWVAPEGSPWSTIAETCYKVLNI